METEVADEGTGGEGESPSGVILLHGPIPLEAKAGTWKEVDHYPLSFPPAGHGAGNHRSYQKIHFRIKKKYMRNRGYCFRGCANMRRKKVSGR